MLNVIKVNCFHVTVVLALLTGNQVSAASWLCVPEAGAGFEQRTPEASWEGITLAVNRSYLVRPWRSTDPYYESGGKPPIYLIEIVGQGIEPLAFIHDEIIGREWIESGVGKVDFQMNLTTNRFVLLAYFGYMLGKGDEEAPFVEIGACSQID